MLPLFTCRCFWCSKRQFFNVKRQKPFSSQFVKCIRLVGRWYGCCSCLALAHPLCSTTPIKFIHCGRVCPFDYSHSPFLSLLYLSLLLPSSFYFSPIHRTPHHTPASRLLGPRFSSRPPTPTPLFLPTCLPRISTSLVAPVSIIQPCLSTFLRLVHALRPLYPSTPTSLHATSLRSFFSAARLPHSYLIRSLADCPSLSSHPHRSSNHSVVGLSNTTIPPILPITLAMTPSSHYLPKVTLCRRFSQKR